MLLYYIIYVLLIVIVSSVTITITTIIIITIITIVIVIVIVKSSIGNALNIPPLLAYNSCYNLLPLPLLFTILYNIVDCSSSSII